MSKIILNKGQSDALEKFKNWIKSSDEEFVLTGYAGTGKTFLLKIFCEFMNDNGFHYKVVTPTGKAASVLIKKGIKASTIHKLIYNPIEDPKTKIIYFEKKSIDDLIDFDFIIADEATMISAEMHEDLLSINKRIIYSGDIGQLPPVGEKNNIFDIIDAALEENVRQKGDNNQITVIAEKARKGQALYPGKYGNVSIINKLRYSEQQLIEIYKRADQVLCGTNATRHRINQLLKLDPRTTNITAGDKVICLRNNDEIEVDQQYGIELCNGLVGTCTKLYTPIKNFDLNINFMDFKFEDNEPRENIIFSLIDENNMQMHNLNDRVYNSPNFKLYNKLAQKHVSRSETLKINQFDPGYAISVHKSQGSEWDNVVLIDESFCFREDRAKWLYTGITRAAKNLIIIK